MTAGVDDAHRERELARLRLRADALEQAQRELERRLLLVDRAPLHTRPVLSTIRRPSSAATTTVSETSSTTTATAITCGSWLGKRSAE